MKKLRKNKKGFTLVEVVVVLVIIAILIAIAVPAVMKYVDDANDAKLEAQARGAMIAAEAEIVKDYAEDGVVNKLGDLNATVAEEIGIVGVEVKAFTEIKNNGAGVVFTDENKPNDAKVFEVKLGDSDYVVIEKNGKVEVNATPIVEFVAAP